MTTSNLTKNLTQIRSENKKGFAPFITAGFPNFSLTKKLALSFAEQGASFIEIGIPFSDPMADGPTIQKANEHALENGATVRKTLQLVKDIRKQTDTPILLMGYYNPIYKYGLKKFARDAANAGVDALLIVDLPIEESQELRTELENKPIDLVYLLTPTSTPDRIKLVKQFGSGFVYYVSYTGTTGSQELNLSEIKKHVLNIKKTVSLPIFVGFGISTPDHVKKICSVSDGVIVGSAILKQIDVKASAATNFKKVTGLTKKLIRASR